MSDLVDARLELAKALRELADGSSEAALRNALSRSYYSIFHAANVLFGKVKHEDIAKRLGGIDPDLEGRVRKLQQLRSLADYDPSFVDREFKGSLSSLGSTSGGKLTRAIQCSIAFSARLNGTEGVK